MKRREKGDQLKLFASLDKKEDQAVYEVRFFQGQTYYTRKFHNPTDAVSYCIKTLNTTREEVMLNVNYIK